MKISASKTTAIAVTVISVVMWIVWYWCGAVNLSLKANLIPLALLFYSLGDLAKKLPQNEKKDLRIRIGIVAALGALSVIFGAFLNIRISYTGGTFGNIYYCIIAAVSGTLFYYFVFSNWKAVGEMGILCKLGRNSLLIMCTQYCLFKIYDLFSKKMLGISIWHEQSTLKALVVAVFTIILIVLFADIFKKIFGDNKKIMNIAAGFGIR